VECELMRGNFEEESGAAAVLQLLHGGHRFDAVFAANDNMAIGALAALRSRGVSVPEEVAVAGFDDIPLARHVGLTTVQVHIDELGERALVRLLSSIGNSDSGGDELHAPGLVVRGTTDPGAQR
jgi:LacI family transcriptional regulator